MKKLTLLIVLPLLLTNCAISKRNADFNLLFGSGFKNDKVSLEINETLIFENQPMNTDSIIGIVNDNNISYNGGVLKLLDKKGTILKNLPIDFDKTTLKFVVNINQKPYLFYPNLKKGQNLILNKDKYYYNVYLNQNKKIIKLE